MDIKDVKPGYYWATGPIWLEESKQTRQIVKVVEISAEYAPEKNLDVILFEGSGYLRLFVEDFKDWEFVSET